MRQSTANKRYVKQQVSVIRVYTCSERHLTFRRNIDTRRQWSVGNIGRNEWLYWEIVINDHCPGSVAVSVHNLFSCSHKMHMFLSVVSNSTTSGMPFVFLCLCIEGVLFHFLIVLARVYGNLCDSNLHVLPVPVV